MPRANRRYGISCAEDVRVAAGYVFGALDRAEFGLGCAEGGDRRDGQDFHGDSKNFPLAFQAQASYMNARDKRKGKMRKRKKFQPPPLPVEGWPRPYVRDGVPGLPMERQEEVLAPLGFDMADNALVWRDELSRPKIRKRAALPERDSAVSPPHAGEVVYIASLRVLGWDNLDVIRAMAVAAKHQARIHCVDTGETYSADTAAPEILSALTRSEEARRRARMAPAASASGATRRLRIEKGLAIAREHWGRPAGEISVVEIAKLAGLSTRTLYHHLSPRTLAQEEAAHGKRHT
jgi:hypothetical protein